MDIEMSNLLLNALLGVLTILAGVGVFLAVLGYNKYAPILEARLGKEQWEFIREKLIIPLIRAAEESLDLQTGQDKADFVLDLLTDQLWDRFGLVVDEEFLAAMIKGVFKELIDKGELVEAEPV